MKSPTARGARAEPVSLRGAIYFPLRAIKRARKQDPSQTDHCMVFEAVLITAPEGIP